MECAKERAPKKAMRKHSGILIASAMNTGYSAHLVMLQSCLAVARGISVPMSLKLRICFQLPEAGLRVPNILLNMLHECPINVNVVASSA